MTTMFARTPLGGKNRAAANKGLAKVAVPCFADTFVQGGSSVLRIKFSAKTPRHRKPLKRQAVKQLKSKTFRIENFKMYP